MGKLRILDWNMKIENVDEFLKPYYTANKIYEVRDGKVIVDKEYEGQNSQFTLEEFLEMWSGDWIITRIKIGNDWYILKQK